MCVLGEIELLRREGNVERGNLETGETGQITKSLGHRGQEFGFHTESNRGPRGFR